VRQLFSLNLRYYYYLELSTAWVVLIVTNIETLNFSQLGWANQLPLLTFALVEENLPEIAPITLIERHLPMTVGLKVRDHEFRWVFPGSLSRQDQVWVVSKQDTCKNYEQKIEHDKEPPHRLNMI
jgi:hypothetical protein